MGRDPESCCRRALSDARLQHPELATLNREFDIAQIAVVGFEATHHRHQLAMCGRLHLGQIVQTQRVADTSNNILTLCIGEVIAVSAGRARRWIARKRNPRTGIRAEIAEHHRADVDGRAKVMRDALTSTVEARAICVPRVKYSADGKVELLTWMLRKVDSALVADDLFVRMHQVLQILNVEIYVRLNTLHCLGLIQGITEVFTFNIEHRLAKHLNQATVRIPREALVTTGFGKAHNTCIVEPNVQNGLHHSGH